jgi:hypothetical protein
MFSYRAVALSGSAAKAATSARTLDDDPGRDVDRHPRTSLPFMAVGYQWRGDFANDELNALHAETFAHRLLEDDWRGKVERHSLGRVVARAGDEVVGFVNVAWDGGVQAFVLDTMVAAMASRQGTGTRLVSAAVEGARAAGCEWAHVDFEDQLRGFYFGACGFTPTNAGLIALR